MHSCKEGVVWPIVGACVAILHAFMKNKRDAVNCWWVRCDLHAFMQSRRGVAYSWCVQCNLARIHEK